MDDSNWARWQQQEWGAPRRNRLSDAEAVKETPLEPIHIRMMTDDISGIGLWDQTLTFDEEELPLPDDLRYEVRHWVDQYTATIGGTNAHWTMDDLYEHDQRGYALSRKVQAALGSYFRIEYVPETTRLRDELASANQ